MRDTVLEQYLAKMGFLRDDYLVNATSDFLTLRETVICLNTTVS